MGWKLATGADQLAPEVRGRAMPWVKGKLPRIECSITFLSGAEVGRSSPPQFLSGDGYRPHLVIGDPSKRHLEKLADGSWPAEEYIGVAFHEGPEAPEAGEELSVVLTLMNFPNAMYGKLSPGVSFTVREGRKIVGYGTVRRWLA